jgi:pimeloyl-ACP methyl ester carboxylesterase
MDPESRSRQLLTADDGKTLCFAEWGDPQGFPVFFLHGTPGGRLNRHPDEAVYIAENTRLITYDRPGYGGSQRQPGRTVVDCVNDVAAIADHLGVKRFSVTGSSGGGPHVLAVASRLGERVVRARCNVCVAPFELPDLDFYDGMDPLNVTEFEWAVEGEARLVPELEKQLADMGKRVAEDPAGFISEDWNLAESDRVVLAEQRAASVTREATADLVLGGVWGWVDDSLAFVRPWGFDVREIEVPVRVTYGTQDVVVPAAHGAWLGRTIPGAEVVVDDQAGHLSGLDQVALSMHWLVTGVWPSG